MSVLKGKTAIVTGASGVVGHGIAEVLAREGCRLMLTYRSNAEGLADIVRRCEKHAPEIITLRVELENLADIDAIAQTAMERWGGVDILVNNAGITDKIPFLDVKEEEFDRLVATNWKSTFFCAQRIARMMVQRKRGKIINISSLSSRGATEWFAVYSGTKAAINMCTKVMALELAPHNIQVNAIGVGWVPIPKLELPMSPERQKRAMYHIPLGRFVTATDIGELVAFLADDRSDCITGETIFADGGQSMLLSMISRVRDSGVLDAK